MAVRSGPCGGWCNEICLAWPLASSVWSSGGGEGGESGQREGNQEVEGSREREMRGAGVEGERKGEI